MTRFNRTAAAMFAAGALSFAVPALASDVSFPRVVGTGENLSVQYAPGATQNIVGGGVAIARTNGSGETQISYPGNRFVQAGLAGLRPVVVGTGNNLSVAYVPVEQAPVGFGLAQLQGAD